MNNFWLLRRLYRTSVNSSPSPVKFWFDTDSTEWRELVPRQRIGDCSEIHVLGWGLCALLLSSHHTFSVRRIDLFRFLRKQAWTLCFSFDVSTLEASPSESEFSLSEECASTCASKSSRLTVKGWNQTRMPFVGSSLFISFAGSRFSVACFSWSVSVGFPHACMSLRVAAGSANVPNFLKWLDWSFDLDVEDKMLLEYDDNLDTTRSTWSHEYPRVEQNLQSNRIAGVSSSNCTVTNRSRSWTKTCAFSFICTAPGRGKSLTVFWTFSKYPLYLSSNLLGQRCALKLPNTQ